MDDRDNVHWVSWVHVKRALTLRHAMTICKSQSCTIAGHVRIVPGRRPGLVSRHFGLSHLLVAASRATSLANLSIE